jgi:glycosyltransferase involved in cell wall biosynthesis
MKNFSPALVHTHMAKAGTLARSTALSMRWRPLLVHTFHGHVLDGYFSKPVRDAFLFTERFLGARTDALIAVSDEIRDELLDLGIGRPDRWHVIPLGFDLSGFLKSVPGTGPLKGELGLTKESSLVGIVGRLVPIKDHRTALEAFLQLPDNVHLAIVGDGEERNVIEELVGSMGLESRVHFLGWRMDVETVMSSLDVVLLSSRNEGSPVALIEASACGVPVVATDVGGVRSVVQDGQTGLLVPPGSPSPMARAVETLIADPGLRAHMGEAGRAHVMERFALERLVADIRTLYSDLLMGRS